MVIKRRNITENDRRSNNFYFRMANLPIRYVSEVGHWRRGKQTAFQMLNGDRFHAKIMDARTVALITAGQSLWDRMGQGNLNERMLEAGDVSTTGPSIPGRNFGAHVPRRRVDDERNL